MHVHSHCAVLGQLAFTIHDSFTVKSHCLQICASRSQPCQLPHMTSILIILKASSPVAVVNADCLQKVRTGFRELLQGS